MDDRNDRIDGPVSSGVKGPLPIHETKLSTKRPGDTSPRRLDDGSVRTEMSDLIRLLDDINQHSPVSLDAALAQARSIGYKLGVVGGEDWLSGGVAPVPGDVSPDRRTWIEGWVRGAKQLIADRFSGDSEQLQEALAWVDQKAVAMEKEMIDHIDALGKARADGVLRESLSAIPPARPNDKRTPTP